MKKRNIAYLALAAALAVSAVPARRGARTVMQPDGSVITCFTVGDERAHYCFAAADSSLLATGDDGLMTYARLAADGTVVSTGIAARDGLRCPRAARLADLASLTPRATRSRAARVPANMLTTTFPSQGEPRALVVLVEFPDKKFTVDNPRGHFEAMLNAEGYDLYGNIGSARDYFIACSSGKFAPVFDVYGPVTLANNAAYYGRNDSNGDDLYPHEMAIEAADLLDDQIDFTVYDTDNDGKVDNIYVFYAGMGEADTSNQPNLVWPHSYDLSAMGATVKHDGVTLDHYATSNELNAAGEPAGISTFCHEFSHVLGLPDLYATTYNSSYTPGEWTILDAGSYNGPGEGGNVPPLYTAFERLSMGWIEPREIGEPADITLRPLGDNDACIISTARNNEFFLFENRQQHGFDAYIPGHGMLVWHIDYNREFWNYNMVNNLPNHQYVDLEEADNSRNEYKRSRASEAFPGTRGVTSFTDDTAPSMKSWNGTAQNKPITGIAEAGGLITFKVSGGADPAAGIDDVAGDAAGVRVVGRRISAPDVVSVYTLSGAAVGSGVAVEVPAPGVYIVAAGETRAKVMVR